MKVRVGDKWEELVSKTVLERRHWYHVPGTYDGDTGTMSLYVDGNVSGRKRIAKGSIALSQKDVVIGKGKPRRPIRPVRAQTFIDSYSFDGLLDKIRIHETALTARNIGNVHTSLRPDAKIRTEPSMDVRKLPDGDDTRKFGAYYDHLDFYETWDNLCRFGDYPDVVVEFDGVPGKFVFWRVSAISPWSSTIRTVV